MTETENTKTPKEIAILFAEWILFNEWEKDNHNNWGTDSDDRFSLLYSAEEMFEFFMDDLKNNHIPLKEPVTIPSQNQYCIIAGCNKLYVKEGYCQEHLPL